MSDGLILFLYMLAGGLLTFATRVAFLLGGERFHLGPRFRAMLAYVPPAVLAALIAPEIFVHEARLDFAPGNPRLWAGLVAVGVALHTKSVLLTIALGLASLWLMQAWVG